MDETGANLECPVRPDFVTLQCADSTQPDNLDELIPVQANLNEGLPFGLNRADLGSSDFQFICRELINPFTGKVQPTTLFEPEDRSIDGDICGCCDGVCSLPDRPMFERPQFIEKSCSAEDSNSHIPCEMPPPNDELDGELNEGFFVCRTFLDPRGIEESRKEAICISGDRAFETDECGCCGGDCPEQPRNVDIDCSGDSSVDQECQFKNGESGVFVCRTIFHPLGGQVHQRSFCIPPDRAWITDVCGCCEDGCPTARSGAFDDESTQLEAMALEVPDDTSTEEAAANVANSGSGRSSLGALRSSATLTAVGIFFLLW
jgi:hypothetical protein